MNSENSNKSLTDSFPFISSYLERHKHYFFSNRRGNITYYEWTAEEESCWGWRAGKAVNEQQRISSKNQSLNYVEEYDSPILTVLEEIGDSHENQMYASVLITELWNCLNQDQKKLFAMILHEHGLDHYAGKSIQPELLEIIDSMDLRPDGKIPTSDKVKNLNMKKSGIKYLEESLYYKFLPLIKEI